MTIYFKLTRPADISSLQHLGTFNTLHQYTAQLTVLAQDYTYTAKQDAYLRRDNFVNFSIHCRLAFIAVDLNLFTNQLHCYQQQYQLNGVDSTIITYPQSHCIVLSWLISPTLKSTAATSGLVEKQD
jgi:hypothetical protein